MLFRWKYEFIHWRTDNIASVIIRRGKGSRYGIMLCKFIAIYYTYSTYKPLSAILGCGNRDPIRCEAGIILLVVLTKYQIEMCTIVCEISPLLTRELQRVRTEVRSLDRNLLWPHERKKEYNKRDLFMGFSCGCMYKYVALAFNFQSISCLFLRG